MTHLPFLTASERRFVELQLLVRPSNNNTPCHIHAASSEKVDALLSQLNAVKQTGRTDYEAPDKPMGRLIIKPSPAWRKLVTLG